MAETRYEGKSSTQYHAQKSMEAKARKNGIETDPKSLEYQVTLIGSQGVRVSGDAKGDYDEALKSALAVAGVDFKDYGAKKNQADITVAGVYEVPEKAKKGKPSGAAAPSDSLEKRTDLF